MHSRWQRLYEAMARTGMYDMSRLTPRLLAATTFAGRSVLLGQNRSANENGLPDLIEAYIARLKTRSEKWQEVALAFVVKERRENGLLKKITAKLIAGTPEGVRVFLFTRDTAMMKVALAHGFTPTTCGVDPSLLHWAEELGIAARLPDEALNNCLPDLTAGNRVLFVRH